MNAYELTDKLGGEIVRGQCRYFDGKVRVVLGRLDGDEMVLTEAGRLLAREYEVIPARKPRVKKPEMIDVVPAAPPAPSLSNVDG